MVGAVVIARCYEFVFIERNFAVSQNRVVVFRNDSQSISGVEVLAVNRESGSAFSFDGGIKRGVENFIFSAE